MQKWLKYSILGSAALIAACGDSETSSLVEDESIFTDEDGVEHTITGCFMERIDEGYRVICGEDSVGVFLNEDNGKDAHCTMSPVKDGYKVICDKDSVGVLVKDENGLIGEKGEDGTSCTVATLEKGYQIVCGEDSVEVVNENIKEKASISLRVVDYNTGLPITSALVLSAGANDSLYTDTLGVLTIKENVLGDYTYIVSKKGYASQVQHVSLTEDGDGDVARVRDEFTDIKLHATGVTVNGTVLYTDGHTKAVVGASKVKVVLTFDAGENVDLYPAEVSTTTDSLGVYSFTNLPEKVGYSIYVPQTQINGSTYASTTTLTTSNLRVGERKDLQTIRLGIVGLVPELIKDNLSGIEEKDTIVFQFSTALIADSIAKSWKVYKGSCYTGVSVLTNASLDKNSTKLSIAPVKGKWTNFDSYCVSGTGYTNDGQRVTVEKTFIPGNINKDLSSITKLKASNYYDNYIKLSWKPTADNITGYKVYYKTNKENDFREVTEWDRNGVGRLPIDSSSCYKTKNIRNCDQYNDISTSYSTYETNYYWYTKFVIDSSLDYDDYYEGYDDSTSTLNLWYVTEPKEVTSSSVYDYSTTVYLWKKVKAVTCEVTQDEYELNYGYEGCDEYVDYGSPYKSDLVGDEDHYYTYTWYVDVSPIAYDSCEVTSGSYTSCPEYELYSENYGKSYYTRTYKYYVNEIVKIDTCSTPGNNSYSYESCEQYETFGRNPNTRTTVYWNKTPTDSVSCTVKNGGDMRNEPKCDSLIRAFATESFLADYTSGYYYYSNPYNSKSSDNNYTWYTKYANVVPTATDSLAFINKGVVFSNDDITSASFIVLPYISLNNEVITANVAEADSSTITFPKK